MNKYKKTKSVPLELNHSKEEYIAILLEMMFKEYAADLAKLLNENITTAKDFIEMNLLLKKELKEDKYILSIEIEEENKFNFEYCYNVTEEDKEYKIDILSKMLKDKNIIFNIFPKNNKIQIIIYGITELEDKMIEKSILSQILIGSRSKTQMPFLID